MQSFVISVSDAGKGQSQNSVTVPDLNELPEAVQEAVHNLLQTSGNVRFPLFIDIHPASQFEHVEWMHREQIPSRADVLLN